MASLNELVRDMRIEEVVRALITAYRSRNLDYLLSALGVIHDEFTYSVSDQEELRGDALSRALTLHALYCLGLGMVRSIRGEALGLDIATLLTSAFEESDVTNLTKALSEATMRALANDYSWMGEVVDLLSMKRGLNPIVGGIVDEFIKIINLVKSLTSS